MKYIIALSDYILPLFILIPIIIGLIRKKAVYDDFVEGAKEGMRTVAGIMPTLIGLMVAVGVLRSSGLLEGLAQLLAKPSALIGVPASVVPVTIVKMFSSSAATGLVLDIFKTFGPDSYEGILTSIIMSSTETIFYTMSVYFLAARVTKTGWTLPGALIATGTGVITSVIITYLLFR